MSETEMLRTKIQNACSILDLLPDAIQILDERGNIIFENTSYQEWTERGREGLVRTERESLICGASVKIIVYYDISEIRRLRSELDKMKQKLKNTQRRMDFSDFAGESLLIQQVIHKAVIASPTPATVMLRGESGTGKEILAHAIHNNSMRRNQAFVKINCSSIPEDLLESELFGYTEGAFTGALRGGKKGLFHEANQGTLFLDEIGDISQKMQVKLLRVLQEREIRPIGSSKNVRVDVRIICATHKNLEEMVRSGEFREDLYYRLNVFPIYIPPLRDRKEDIAVIAGSILKRCNEFYGRKIQDIDSEALKLLKDRSWLGNVRELENVISRIIIHMPVEKNKIDRQDVSLVLEYIEQPMIGPLKSDQTNLNLSEVVKDAERNCIKEALALCENDKNQAAVILGIPVRTLYYKCKKLGIQSLSVKKSNFS